MSRLVFILLFILFLARSEGQVAYTPVQKPENILKNFTTFWKYWNEAVFLDRQYLAVDEGGKTITREVFLRQLVSGNYLPLRMKSQKELVYALYNSGGFAEPDIGEQIIAHGQTLLKHFLWEGKNLPDFNFTDIDGKNYSSENTKGRFLILKCWFIHCTKCVLEMPELNKLVEQYKKRDDILFVSLASDSTADLVSFRKNRHFAYAIVSGADDYMLKN